jgi:hypothetical protein
MAYMVRPILAWIHSASTLSLLYSSLSTAGTFSCVISAFLLLSASKYGAIQPRHCAVPVRRSPDVEFGSIRFTNRVQTHCRCLHQREATAVGSVASLASWSPAAGSGSSASTAVCLRAGLGASRYPRPALEVGHVVGLVAELVQV